MLYQVTVKPGSKKGPLVLQQGNELTVYLRERPIAGQANRALIALLAEYFHLPKTSIQLRHGAHGRKKLLEIPNL